jgi:integrase/recombinase XerD
MKFERHIDSEAPKKRGPKGEVVGKGLSSKIAHTYVNAIRSFYGTFDVYVKLRGRSALPKPKVVNKRMILSNMDVKRLVDHASTVRDRAIILTMFQSGIDVSTLCSLKYGDVAEGLAKNEHPLRLNLYRPKTETEYYTFLGGDAVKAIRAYLNDLKAKGIKITSNTPLFLKASHKTMKCEGLTPNLVQNMLREVAVKSGLVDENLNGRDFNPLSPHALRESFASIMINKGVPDTIVDFWLGHEIGEMAEAYKRSKFEDLKRIYLEREVFISISTAGEIEEKLRAEIDEKNRQLQALVNGLTAENMSLKAELNALKQRLEKLEAIAKEQVELQEAYEKLLKLIEQKHPEWIAEA